MKEYLISAPKSSEKSRFIPAHLIYRIRDGRLLREQIPLSLRGGMMVIGRVESPFSNSLSAAILRECLRFDFESVFIALPPFPATEHIAFADEIYTALSKRDLPLFLPLPYIGHCTVTVVPGFVSEGKFTDYLNDLCQKYKNNTIALELSAEPLDFILPTKSVRQLSQNALHSLLENTGAMTFYSSELCCNYFTYTDTNTHLVTFDTAHSLIEKRNIANSFDINACIYAISPKNNTLRAKLELQK